MPKLSESVAIIVAGGYVALAERAATAAESSLYAERVRVTLANHVGSKVAELRSRLSAVERKFAKQAELFDVEDP